MAAVLRQTAGSTVELPPDPVLPVELGYIWLAWHELHAGRSIGMAPNPISWPDLAAYQQVLDERLEPWEARAIRAVDNAYIASLQSDGVGDTGAS